MAKVEARAASGLKGVMEQFSSFNETVQAAAAAEETAKEQARASALAEQAGETMRMAALIESAYLVAAADGSFSPNEAETLVTGVSGATGGAIGQDTIQALLDGAVDRLSTDGQAGRLVELGAVVTDPDLRRAALSLACGIAWLDRGIGDKQGLALQGLARAFDIPIPEMHKILGAAKA